MSGNLIRRYWAREIFSGTLFVIVAFLALFAFFDFITELSQIGKGGYSLLRVMGYVALLLPGHAYELAPIAVLIGTLFALSSFASTSEFVAMRSGGISPGAAAKILFQIGLLLVAVTFLIGEFLAPVSERLARELKLKSLNSTLAQEFRSGLWVKDNTQFINVSEVLPDLTLNGVKIFEFDGAQRLLALNYAERGKFLGAGEWQLERVVRTEFLTNETKVRDKASVVWKSAISPEMLTILFIAPERMSVLSLFQYLQHLSQNQQKTERYEIAFWKKILYPGAILVMMALALPFAYIHARSGGLGVKVFAGLMLGVLFNMLNSLFSHLGLLQNWQPFVSAALPNVAFLVIALVMMGVVLRS